MRLSELNEARVFNANGKYLGRVHEVHVRNGRIEAIVWGNGGFVQRMTGKSYGRMIGWECVRDVRRHSVYLRIA